MKLLKPFVQRCFEERNILCPLQCGSENSRLVVENNDHRNSAQYFLSNGDMVQQQQFGRNSRVSRPMT